MIEFIQVYQGLILGIGCAVLFILACVMQVGKNREDDIGS